MYSLWRMSDRANATSAGYTMYVGTNPNPTPCNGSNDMVCRQHLTGAGMFDVAASPRDPQLACGIHRDERRVSRREHRSMTVYPLWQNFATGRRPS